MILLMAIDSSFVYLSVTQTLKKGASVLLLFAFEVRRSNTLGLSDLLMRLRSTSCCCR